MELKIRKKNNDLVLEFPDDLAQLPSLLKSFSGVLAEPEQLQRLQEENQKLKAEIESLRSESGLKTRLSELGEEKYCRWGEELGFVEVVHEDENQITKATDTLSENPAENTPSRKIKIMR